MRAIAERLDAELPSSPTTRVTAESSGEGLGMVTELRAGVVYSLRRKGWAVTAPELVPWLGAAYASRPADQVVRVGVDAPALSRGRTLAMLAVPDPIFETAPPRRTVSVTLLPGTAR